MKLKKYIKRIYERLYNLHEENVINSILLFENFEPIQNEKISKINKICIVIMQIGAFQGGHTSILRLGTFLSKKGIDIYYACVWNQSISSLEKNAKINLLDYRGKFIRYDDALKMNFDVCVATSWRSVFYTKKLSGYMTYFVQDYEPYFFKIGERFLLAKKTYELGFHIISLGQWNVKQIVNNCNTTCKINYIDFPCEKKEYKYVKRDFVNYKNKKEITIAVYSKEEGKRVPNLIQSILINSQKKLKDKYNICLVVNFFGFDKNYKVKIGKNLGKLNKQELNELYQKSDFGMVASMSNISLVPYEMIASGLPLIEFIDGSFLDFFPSDSAMLISYNSDSFVEEIIKRINNPSIIETEISNALSYIEKLSWENSINQFYDILKEEMK